MMNLRDLSIICGKEIEIKKSNNPDEWRFQISISGLEIKEGGVLISAYGIGETKTEAMKDYADSIQGKMVVVDAMKPTRRVFQLPERISASVRK